LEQYFEDAYTVIFESTILPVRPHSLWTDSPPCCTVDTDGDEVLLTGMTLEGDVAGYPEHHRRPETHVFRASKAATKQQQREREEEEREEEEEEEEEEQEQEQDPKWARKRYICVTSISQTR
jgi:hypothetical protein